MFNSNSTYRESAGELLASYGVLKIVWIYVGFGSLWIFISDRILGALFHDPTQSLLIGTIKGLLFICATAVLLMLLLRNLVHRLSQREFALHLIAEQAGDALVVFDAHLRVAYANPAACQMSGYTAEELCGRSAAVFFPEALHPTLQAHLERLADQPISRDEWQIRRKDGDLKTANLTTQRLPDGRYLAIGRDVTQAHAAQEALVKSERRFRSLFENASDAVFVMDADGRFSNVNQRACASLGYTREQLLGMKVTDVDTDYSIGEVRDIWRDKCDGNGITIYGHHRRADGSCFPVEVRVSRHDVDEQHYFISLARDITEREQHQKALRSSEEFSRAVLDSTSSQVAVLDSQGHIVAVNESWRRFGRERQTLPPLTADTGIGTDFLEVCRNATGEDSESAMEAYWGVLQVLRGDSAQFHLDCACHFAGEEKWFIMNVTPLRTGSGGAVVTYLDVTEMKLAQAMQERAAVQLKALAGKHLSIQEEERRLLSMEIHDQIGQMLTSLKLTLATAQPKCADQPLVQPQLGHAIETVDAIINTTRDIARRLRPPMLDDLGLTSAVRWHINKLAIPDSTRVSLYENLGQERLPPGIELAAFRLIQEAVSNALQHARASDISVSITRQNNHLHLSVCDDGIGFDTEETSRKSVNLTSLGLLGMRERVASFYGNIQLQSAPGAGTSLVASIPLPLSA